MGRLTSNYNRCKNRIGQGSLIILGNWIQQISHLILRINSSLSCWIIKQEDLLNEKDKPKRLGFIVKNLRSRLKWLSQNMTSTQAEELKFTPNHPNLFTIGQFNNFICMTQYQSEILLLIMSLKA
jgi:hypothetical protein